MSEQMKPCPFPHSAEDGEGNPADYPPSVVLGIGSKVGECWVECEWCGASGPAEATEAAAIAAWNQRAGDAELAALRDDRDKASGAALEFVQRNYDQAQELAKLRKLREACEALDANRDWHYVDSKHYYEEWSDIVANLDKLAACDEASAND